MRLVFQPSAEDDLTDIALYIARDNRQRAIRFVRELRAQCRKLMTSPQGYRLRPELGKDIRSCAYGNYVIFFTANDEMLCIVRVLHGAMDSEMRFSDLPL